MMMMMEVDMLNKVKHVVAEIDDTMPEIRKTWIAVRDTLCTYIGVTLIVSAVILSAGLVAGAAGVVYAYFNTAEAQEIEQGVCPGYPWYTKSVKSSNPHVIEGPGQTWGSWERREKCGGTNPTRPDMGLLCDCHNPSISCPAGWQRVAPGGGVYVNNDPAGELVASWWECWR